MPPNEVYATRCSDLGAFLGDDVDRTPSDDGTGNVPSPSGRDVIAERLAHARGEGPEPEADVTPPQALAALAPGLIDIPPEYLGGADTLR